MSQDPAAGCQPAAGAGKRAYPLGRAQLAKLPHNRVLEHQLQSKLQVPRVVRGSHVPEVARREASDDAVELGVVEAIEGFRPELQAATAGLTEGEALEQ